MAAKKKTAGSGSPKKKKKKKAAAKKKAPAKKKAAPKKAAATKAKTAPKKKAAAKKAAAPKKAVASEKQPKKASPEKPPAADRLPGKVADAPAKTATGTISTSDVNLGHVFALKPRVNTSFRQNHFLEAKRALRDERYSSIADAARAVAEEALSLTRGGAARPDFKRRS